MVSGEEEDGVSSKTGRSGLQTSAVFEESVAAAGTGVRVQSVPTGRGNSSLPMSAP